MVRSDSWLLGEALDEVLVHGDRTEENVAVSRLAATMSAYLCTDQKP